MFQTTNQLLVYWNHQSLVMVPPNPSFIGISWDILGYLGIFDPSDVDIEDRPFEEEPQFPTSSSWQGLCLEG